MLKAVKINPAIYCSLPVKVKINRDILVEIASRDPHQFKYATDIKKEYRDAIFTDKKLALLAAKKSPYFLYEYFYSEVLLDTDVQEVAFSLSTPEECIKKLHESPWALKYVNPIHWRDDMDLVSQALDEDGMLFEFLPDDYKCNKKLALIALKNAPESIMFFSEELRDDASIVKKALRSDTEQLLSFVSERLRDDYDIVYKAVSVDGLNLQYASTKLQDNREIVLRAIKEYGGSLEYASERLQKDMELIDLAHSHM